MSQNIVSNTTVITLFEEDKVSTNNSEYIFRTWMLKVILLQLGICCFLILCYIGIKIRIQKLNRNKQIIQQQIENEKNEKNETNEKSKTNSDGDQPLNPNSASIESLTSTRLKFNNSGGISMFAMPNQSSKHINNHAIHTLQTNELTNDNKLSDSENDNEHIRYNIKQLMNKVISKSKNTNTINDKYIKTEIEMSFYNHKNSIDGPLSYRSTFANNTTLIHAYNRNRIDTDNTFPSIPNDMSDIENQSEGIDTHTNGNNLDTHTNGNNNNELRPNDNDNNIRKSPSYTPIYNYYHVGTPDSSICTNNNRTTSYIQVCQKCGNAHGNNVGCTWQ